MTATRSRWAALGAAVAISLGAGGLGIVGAASGPGEVSELTNITPCRLADTRPGEPGVRSTPLGAGEDAQFAVHGTNGDCTIPASATAIVANLTAFNATTSTYVNAHRADVAAPLAAVFNLVPGELISNSVDIELSAAGALKVFNLAGTTDIVIDVTGYYSNRDLDARYAQKSVTYTKTEVDAKVAAATYTDAQADARIAAKTYTQAEVDAKVAAISVPIIKRGATVFGIGKAGILVTFDTPMPSADYTLVIQPLNSGGYSTTSDATYFNPLKKTATGFQIQHKTTLDDIPLAVDTNVSMDWIAVHD
ncbi:MAG: hypothetical protein HKN44_05820 [Ilumatobacter sp.]|nr:hypothetical protein [Ilumatobacter sp.]